MPLYTFDCTKCDFTADHVVSISERDRYQPICGACNGVMVRRKTYAAHLGRENWKPGLIMENGERRYTGRKGRND